MNKNMRAGYQGKIDAMRDKADKLMGSSSKKMSCSVCDSKVMKTIKKAKK